VSLSKDLLVELYYEQGLSMAEIAEQLGCSVNKVVYWMNKHGIERRSLSEAIYRWHNRDDDPFDIHEPESDEERALFQLGVGLYIGEGAKRGRYQVSLSNTDPRVIRLFLRFLREICGVSERRIFAWINIFDDVDLEEAQTYWEEVTWLPRPQFYRSFVRPRRGGTYRNISRYGTIKVGVSNTELYDIVQEWCEEYLEEYS